MRLGIPLICIAASLLFQGCATGGAALQDGPQSRRSGQLCRWEHARCETVVPDQLEPAEAALWGLQEGLPR